jgi:hypothetical protein
MSCLHLCPACERHVRSVETTCPFCDATLPEDFGVCAEPRATGRPLTRAAFILMSATALTACGKSAGPGVGPGGGAEIYGPPPVDVRPDASATTQNQPPPPTPQPEPVAVYGPAPVADPVPAPPNQKK